MLDKIKIKISTIAYDKLIDTLKFDDEYNCYRIKYLGKCCSHINVELLLDNIENEPVETSQDIINTIDALPIAYDKSMLKTIESITIVFRNSAFQIKVIGTEGNEKRHCSSCKNDYSGCML